MEEDEPCPFHPVVVDGEGSPNIKKIWVQTEWVITFRKVNFVVFYFRKADSTFNMCIPYTLQL